MTEGGSGAVVEAEGDDLYGSNTRAWVERSLRPGDRICAVATLRGGWTSQMRRLEVEGEGETYSLVLRSFVKPFFMKHARLVELPLHVARSGLRTLDLDLPRQRMSLYRTVLAQGMRDDPCRSLTKKSC